MSTAVVSRTLIATLLCTVVGACSLVEMSGKMTRATGEVMSEYAKTNDGVIGKMAGFGGRVNTSVGTAVENASRTDNPNKGAGERLATANSEVWNAATDAAGGKAKSSSSGNSSRKQGIH